MRKRVIVHGRVQGVWFRDGMRRLAVRERVRGWVRNRADGTVEAVLEGEPDAVERLVSFARIGPPGAHVTRVDERDEPGGEPLDGFAIR